MAFQIEKASGEVEKFEYSKLRRSLARAGARTPLIDEIEQEVRKREDEFKTTHDVYSFAYSYLSQKDIPSAARYNLKKALLDFGPTGYPFEDFVAQIFKYKGFESIVREILNGKCITHEIDVMAFKDNGYSIIECKFHNMQKNKSEVHTSLYMNSRFADIEEVWLTNNPYSRYPLKHCWIVTNTKFTDQATQYAECKGISLLSWNYPLGKGLAQTIDELGLHPITALPILTDNQKEAFIKKGFVLCRDARKNIELLRQFGFNDKKIEKIIQVSEDTCQLKST